MCKYQSLIELVAASQPDNIDIRVIIGILPVAIISSVYGVTPANVAIEVLKTRVNLIKLNSTYQAMVSHDTI